MKDKINVINITQAIEGVYPKQIEGLFMLELEKITETNKSYMFEEVCIILCLGGQGSIFINEKEYIIGPNIILFIPSNYIVRTTSNENQNKYNFKVLFFSSNLIPSRTIAKDYQIVIEIRKRSCIKISAQMMNELVLYYDFLKNKSEKPATIFKEKIIKNLLLTYLIKVTEAYALSDHSDNELTKSRGIVITEQFFELVSIHFKEERKLNFYADKMCVSVKYLSQTIKKTTNQSAISWINQSVIYKIKHLLKTTDMTAAEIANHLNFPNASFFGRYFKDHTNATPNQFRNN